METLTSFICNEITMVMVITTLKPKCISVILAYETSYNCTNLGAPPNTMNLAEGNTTTICETQSPTNNGKIYLLSFQYICLVPL